MQLAQQKLKQAALQSKDNRLGFLALALEGKSQGFEQITQRIDEMVQQLKDDQKLDNEHKDKCQKDIQNYNSTYEQYSEDASTANTEKTAAGSKVDELDTKIKTLEKEIVSLDQQAAEKGLERKNEANELLNQIAQQQKAKGFLQRARAKIAQNKGVNQILGLFDGLIRDIDVELADLKNANQNGQKDYENVLKHLTKDRKDDVRQKTTFNAEKAEVEETYQQYNKDFKDASKLADKNKELLQLLVTPGNPESCKFILEKFEFRKEARTQEIENLISAGTTLRNYAGEN